MDNNKYNLFKNLVKSTTKSEIKRIIDIYEGKYQKKDYKILPNGFRICISINFFFEQLDNLTNYNILPNDDEDIELKQDDLIKRVKENGCFHQHINKNKQNNNYSFSFGIYDRSVVFCLNNCILKLGEISFRGNEINKLYFNFNDENDIVSRFFKTVFSISDFIIMDSPIEYPDLSRNCLLFGLYRKSFNQIKKESFLENGTKILTKCELNDYKDRVIIGKFTFQIKYSPKKDEEGKLRVIISPIIVIFKQIYNGPIIQEMNDNPDDYVLDD